MSKKFLDLNGLTTLVNKILDKLNNKFDKNQGVENAGKILSIDEKGEITTTFYQSDYEQNDDTKIDYIKNRPFYSYENSGDVLFDEDITLTTGTLSASYTFTSLRLTNGAKYLVQINNEVLTLECGTEMNLVGTPYHSTIGQSVKLTTNMIAIIMWASTSFHLKISTIDTTVVPIDEKYIPDLSKSVKNALVNSQTEWSEDDQEKARQTIGAISADDVPKQVQSDWEQNDETAPDYIKNRPFYECEDNIEVLIDGETDFYGAGDSAFYNFNFQLIEGVDYEVQINGECFIIKCGERLSLDAQYYSTIGHIIGLEYNKIWIQYYATNNYYLKISTVGSGEAILKTLDDKFIPDTILRYEIEETLETPDVSLSSNYDGNGNVTVETTGMEITDDGNGNVSITSEHLTAVDNNGNITISV